MPQFIIIAYDGTDREAAARRQLHRQAHLDNITRHRAHILCGVALLDARGEMNGSLLITNFPDRAAADTWLKADPYVTGNVWQTISVLDAKLPPVFQDMIKPV